MPERVAIAIITGSCCNPHMPPFDAEAKRVVDQALSETGMAAEVHEVPATRAFFGGGPLRTVLLEVMRLMNEEGTVGLPAVVVDGQVVSYGVPTVETMKAALLRIAAPSQRPAMRSPLISAATGGTKER